MKIKIGDYVETKNYKGKVLKVDEKYVYIKLPLNHELRIFTDRIGVPFKSITKHEPFKCYEVLWYERDVLADIYVEERMFTKEFATRKEALNFYDKYKKDKEKYGWWITKRNLNWEIIEDIIL